jgi:hypothetical protein
LDGDVAFAYVSGFSYFYVLDDDIGGAESSPDKITPDANAGNKRWILQGIILPNAGLKVLDTNGSHCLVIKPGSDLSAERILTITTGDAARTLTLAGDLTTAGAVSVSAFAATMLDDAAAGDVLTTLGVSAYAKTLLDDADAATAVATLGITATAAEINTVCDGSTAKNSHTHTSSCTAGAVVVMRDAQESTTVSTTYVKVKEILIGSAGTLSFSWSHKTSTSYQNVYTKIYRNGVAVGTEKTTNSDAYQAATDEIAGWSAGDLCQMYLHGTGGYDGYVKNWTVMCAEGSQGAGFAKIEIPL